MAAVRERLDRMAQTWSPPTPGDLSSPLRFLLWLTRSQSRRIAIGAVLGTCWMVGLTVPPWLLSRAVDDGLVAGDPAALLGWALILLAVGVLNALVAIGRHRTMTKIRMDAQFRSVRATVRHTSQLGASLARRVSAGEVVTVGISDVQIVAQALTVTGPGVGSVVAYVVVAVVLFGMSPLLAVVVLIGVPLLAVTVGPFLRRLERTGGEYRVHQGRLTTRLVDVLGGLGVLNGLGGKAFVAERYERQSHGLVDRGYRVAGPSSWVGALSGGLPALFLAAVVWLSARMAATGTITIGDLVAVYGYVAILVIPVSQFIEGGADIARARVAGQRIIDLLNLPPDRAAVHHQLPAGGEPVPADQDRSQAERGPGQIPDGCGPLADPETGLLIRPGTMTALVAAHPAEAIAVIDRLGRVGADSDSGVTWAGAPIANVDRAEFRRRLVVADNDAEVFAGTVREVVSGRLAADDDRIRTALRVAVAEDVVDALPSAPGALPSDRDACPSAPGALRSDRDALPSDPDGLRDRDGLRSDRDGLPGSLDAEISAGGSNLSGGQRQRIRLARAVCAGPDVLLAVDPTSAVDAITEGAMIDRLRRARRDRTTVITTTSPLVLDRVDEVIVLIDGSVSAIGTHTDLLRRDGGYRRLISRAQADTDTGGVEADGAVGTPDE